MSVCLADSCILYRMPVFIHVRITDDIVFITDDFICNCGKFCVDLDMFTEQYAVYYIKR